MDTEPRRYLRKKRRSLVLLGLIFLLSACAGKERTDTGVRSAAESLPQTSQQIKMQNPDTSAGTAAAQETDGQTEAEQETREQTAAEQETNEQSAEGTDAASKVQSDAKPTPEPYDFTICFAGDINLHEGWCTALHMKRQENGILDCISPELVEAMNAADVMCLNNEFTYSLRGTPTEGKSFHFRANPERVEVLRQLGVDVVTLANNHVYDYGEDAILDTFETLENAGISYFGAGRTLEEAMQPVYLTIQGKTIALVGASRAEKNKKTPQATETSPGILRCYDPELFLQVIAEAKSNADFCLAFVHWGTENSTKLEPVQIETGRQYLDAGADAVIGAHPHCLQGMEFYDGKPIVYSLGNYWFNEKTLDTMLLELNFSDTDGEDKLEVRVIPALQKGYTTTFLSEPEEQRRLFDGLENISVNCRIRDDGIVEEKDTD